MTRTQDTTVYLKLVSYFIGCDEINYWICTYLTAQNYDTQHTLHEFFLTNVSNQLLKLDGCLRKKHFFLRN